MSDEMIFVGAIAGSFGVKGEVRLKSFTSVPEAIAQYGPVFTEDSIRSFNVSLTGHLKNALSAKLSGVQTKEDADAIRGLQLFVPRSKFPQLPDDEYYYADLVDLNVFDAGGMLIGKVHSVQNHGASDILEISESGTSETVLLPFTRKNVPTIDTKAARIIIDPPDGLFEDLS
jgi:16S rRNA processing protein RimM